jgi:WhiB family redox-sensing transcriptional regulator
MSDTGFHAYVGDLSWIHDAECRGHPTQWWHPRQGQGPQNNINTRTALEICSSCSFVKECLDYGMQTKSSGIYGGVSLYVGVSRNRNRKERKRDE